MGAIRDAAEGASGQRAERFFQGPARPDRRHGPSAGEAGRDDRLAVPGGAVRRGLFGQAGPTAAADKADGGAFDPQAHAQSVRRGPLRALGREPVLSALLRRGVLPPQAAVRPVVADALAPADGRGEARRADPGEPERGDADRRGQALGLLQGDRRHDRAAEGGGVSDRRQAHASGARASGAARQEARRAACANPTRGWASGP